MRMVGAVSTRTSGALSILGLDPDLHGPEIRAQLGVVPQDNLKAIGSHNWVADASDSYTNGFDGQTAAVALVSSTAKGIEDALNGLADGLDAAFSSLEQAAASYAAVIVGLIGALASIETVVGAIIGLVVAVVGLIGVGVNIVTLLVSIGDNTRDDLRELQTNSLKWHEPNFATS